ncbi:S-layer homology domain-containing protein [Brevibacillus humidisoli]|uniref:3D domain-containing protein n=1 Tax=Brevibacillus humidisoli TaxID=2895522 RepID=UPI001E345C4C|nr:S-layer homology domain-containing protein [Brevibacillus humidisoli]UFJ41620.1 S-layer homology domain-containing protein [Brevibacillus humidisoli]
MLKKSLLAVLISLSLISISNTAGAKSAVLSEEKGITDISGHWAESKIRQLQQGGVIEGNDNGQFYPDKVITRSELIAMFVKARGVQPDAGKRVHFADVPDDHWFYPYAKTAYRLGILHGHRAEGGLYLHPDETVSKEEMIAILLRAKGEGGRINQLLWSTTMKTLLAYPDGDELSEWGKRPMVYALQHEITQPSSTGMLQPAKLITRGAAAAYAYDFLYRPSFQSSKYEQTEPVAFRYTRTLDAETTAYNYPDGNVKSYIGAPLRPGIVAVDPNVIALGSHLYIEGYGYAVAADIGGAVKGNRIDLYYPTYQQAVDHGIQQNVKVYVLN